jgi:DNA-binding transcriptional regulator YiaG
MHDWIPEEIKKLRKALKLSQKAFGDLLGVTRNFIYYLERGEREPNKTLRLLMDCVERQFKENEKGKESKKHGKRYL